MADAYFILYASVAGFLLGIVMIAVVVDWASK